MSSVTSPPASRRLAIASRALVRELFEGTGAARLLCSHQVTEPHELWTYSNQQEST